MKAGRPKGNAKVPISALNAKAHDVSLRMLQGMVQTMVDGIKNSPIQMFRWSGCSSTLQRRAGGSFTRGCEMRVASCVGEKREETRINPSSGGKKKKKGRVSRIASMPVFQFLPISSILLTREGWRFANVDKLHSLRGCVDTDQSLVPMTMIHCSMSTSCQVESPASMAVDSILH